MTDNLLSFLTYEKIYYISNIGVLPCWLLLIFLPNHVITKFFVNIYKIIIERLNLEFNDLKLIYNSFVSSLSANGQIAALFILVLIIFFIFFLIFSSGDKKTSSKTKNVKQKSVKAQLLEIEIDLLELQDKYSRKVISLNSYLAETKRLEEKANKIN